MAVDIREVALRSGVSAATVSRALNGRPDVSAATRARVAAVAGELGYLPNSQARALARRRSDIVGLLWDTSYLRTKGRHPFLQDVARRAQDRARRDRLLAAAAQPARR